MKIVKLFIVIIVFFKLSIVNAQDSSLCPSASKVSKIEFVTGINLNFKDLMYGLPFEEGMECDDALIGQSLDALKRRNIFESINYYFEKRGEELILIFELIPFLVLSEVEFFGNSNVFASELLRVSGLKIGNKIFSEDIREAEKRIKKRYLDAGFDKTQLEPSLIASRTSPLVSLEIRVSEGEQKLVSEILFQENFESKFPDVVEQIKVEFLDQPINKDLLSRIKRFTYQKMIAQGYYQASIDARLLDLSLGKIQIGIRSRSKLELEILGNDYFSKEVLLLKLDLDNRTVPLRVGALRNWCEEIKNEYISKGFLEVEIKCNLSDQPITKRSKVKRFSVLVNEGAQYEFKGVEFLGNVKVSNAVLQREVLPGRFALSSKIIWQDLPAISELLNHVSESIRRHYVSEGFLDINVDVSEDRNDSKKTVLINAKIVEGVQSKVLDVEIPTIDGSEHESLAKLFSQFKTDHLGKTYKVLEIAESVLKIENYLSENGYFETKIYPEFQKATGKLKLNYSLSDQIRVRKILIGGNYYTLNNVILRELSFKEGDYFSYDRLEESRRALLGLGIFKSVEIFAITDEIPVNERDVQVMVKERETGIVDGLVEVSTQDGFHIQGQVGQRNLLGQGKALVLSVDGYFKEELNNFDAARARLAYASPKLFGSNLDYKVEGFFQTNLNLNRNFSYDRIGIGNSLRFPFLERFGFTTSHVFYDERLFDVEPDIVLTTRDTGSTFYSAIKTSIEYDQRDDPFNPTEGYRLELGGALFPVALGSEVPLIEGHTQFTTLHPVSSFWTYALNIRGAMTRVSGELDNVPLGSRYFIGGRETLRGYTRYQVSARSQSGLAAGGDTSVSINNEMRYQITDSVLGLIFLDIGQAFIVQDRGFTGDSKSDLSSLRYSPGVGAQYSTPIGPLGVEIGFATDREFGERWGRMLVSIGSAF